MPPGRVFFIYTLARGISRLIPMKPLAESLDCILKLYVRSVLIMIMYWNCFVDGCCVYMMCVYFHARCADFCSHIQQQIAKKSQYFCLISVTARNLVLCFGWRGINYHIAPIVSFSLAWTLPAQNTDLYLLDGSSPIPIHYTLRTKRLYCLTVHEYSCFC